MIRKKKDEGKSQPNNAIFFFCVRRTTFAGLDRARVPWANETYKAGWDQGAIMEFHEVMVEFSEDERG